MRQQRTFVAVALAMLTALSLLGWQIFGGAEKGRYSISEVQHREQERYSISEVQDREQKRYSTSEVQDRERKRYSTSEVQDRERKRYSTSEVQDRQQERYSTSEVQDREQERYSTSEVQDREQERYTTFGVTPVGTRVNIKDSKVSYEGGNCLTMPCNYGRLGNQMFSFASLYGLSMLNNRTVCAAPCLLNWFEKIFEISTPKNRSPSWHQRVAFEIGNYLNPDRDNKIPWKANIIVGEIAPESYTFFHFVRSEILKEFTFQQYLVLHAQNLLRRAALKGPQSVFVGVHVRRGDFTWFLPLINTRLAGVDFYKKAMDIFRRRYSSAVFVVVSDDMDWCRSNLADSDVFIHNGKVSAEYDLALLAHCNHSIFSESTFGFWGAYLAGGQTIYLANVTAPGSWTYNRRPKNKYYLPDWLGINDSNTSHWGNINSGMLLEHGYNVFKPVIHTFMKFF